MPMWVVATSTDMKCPSWTPSGGTGWGDSTDPPSMCAQARGDASTPQQTQVIDPMLVQCWASVVDGGPTLDQHWVYVSCLLGPGFRSVRQQTSFSCRCVLTDLDLRSLIGWDRDPAQWEVYYVGQIDGVYFTLVTLWFFLLIDLYWLVFMKWNGIIFGHDSTLFKRIIPLKTHVIHQHSELKRPISVTQMSQTWSVPAATQMSCRENISAPKQRLNTSTVHSVHRPRWCPISELLSWMIYLNHLKGVRRCPISKLCLSQYCR